MIRAGLYRAPLCLEIPMKTRRSGFAAATVVAAAMALLAACGTTKLPGDAATTPVESRSTAATDSAATSATSRGTPQSGVTTVDLARRDNAAGAGAQVALPGQRVIYFDFDSYVVKGDFQPVLDAHARLLVANRNKQLVVEGHTDERGGREYNLALGQKRAAAVVHGLRLLGASEAQMEAVSFGEERPAATASDEAAWARNRRAELRER
jgi:peptidoglycan-associated lipoprotein